MVFDLTNGSGLGIALGFVTGNTSARLGDTVYREIPGPSKANWPGPPSRHLNVKLSETAAHADPRSKAVAMAGADIAIWRHAGDETSLVRQKLEAESRRDPFPSRSVVQYDFGAADRLSRAILDEQQGRSIDRCTKSAHEALHERRDTYDSARLAKMKQIPDQRP